MGDWYDTVYLVLMRMIFIGAFLLLTLGVWIGVVGGYLWMNGFLNGAP